MDIQLNFLQFKPQKNWLDYFLQRNELYDLLNQSRDVPNIINLCDQFIEQAMVTEKELAQLDKRFLDEEDVICMRHKSSDLWMCAISCFAACDWNLDLLNMNSNVIRIEALLNRLTLWTFEQENQQALLEDPFNYVSIVTTSFNHCNAFIAWLYARWVFTINQKSCFPPIPTKPTVSNPYQYVDQNLLQAEKLFKITLEIQQKMPAAVKLMEKLLNNEQNLENMGGIFIPTKNCFYPKMDIISKGSPVSILLNLPKPNFKAGGWIFNWEFFNLTTVYELVVAHFTARHFTIAKELLDKIQPSLEKYIQLSDKLDDRCKQFLPNQMEFIAYAKALGLTIVSNASFSNVAWRGDGDEDPFMQFVIHRPKEQIPINLLIKMLANGICRVPKIYRETELRDDITRNKLIQSFKNEVDLLGKQHSTISCIQRNRLIGSLYFLCSHTKGFSESLALDVQFLSEYKMRGFANLSIIDTPPKPSDENFQDTEKENLMWNILTSFDNNILRNSFARLESPIYLENKLMVFSTVSGDRILSATNTSGDRFFIRNQIMLWKLEQLARLGNIVKWKEFLNKFNDDCKAIQENAELLIFDLMRIELTDWNNNFYRPADTAHFMTYTADLKTLLNGTMNKAVETKNPAFQFFGKELACYLLNNCEWKIVDERIKNQTLFITPFTTVAIIFAFFLQKLYVEKKKDEAFRTVQEIIWKLLSVTFDALKPGVEQRKCLTTKEQLLDLLGAIKEVEVLNIFIGMVSNLYNFALTTDQKPLTNVSISLDPNISTLSAVGAAMDTSIIHGTDDPLMQQQNAGMHLLRMVGRHLYVDNTELWQSVKMDDYRTYDVDIPYIEKVLDLLCEQAKLVGPIYIPWLRFRADYAFVKEAYQEAAKLYLELAVAIDRGILGRPGVDDSGGMLGRLTKRMDMDLIYGKLSVSLFFLRMPTLAVIVGQMRSDIKPHLSMVEHLLRNTPATLDSGPAYFPLIADIHLMEKMAVAYENPSLDLPLYRQTLLKTMPTRAININNSNEVLEREWARRKERFMEILHKQFFRKNLGRQ